MTDLTGALSRMEKNLNNSITSCKNIISDSVMGSVSFQNAVWNREYLREALADIQEIKDAVPKELVENLQGIQDVHGGDFKSEIPMVIAAELLAKITEGIK